jgi:hypothetical protein
MEARPLVVLRRVCDGKFRVSERVRKPRNTNIIA